MSKRFFLWEKYGREFEHSSKLWHALTFGATICVNKVSSVNLVGFVVLVLKDIFILCRVFWVSHYCLPHRCIL